MAITKPIPGSINAPLGSQQESGVNAYGGVNILVITGLSSDLTTVAQNLALVTGGDVSIENILFETDATGLAGGTTLEFLTDDPIGLAVFASIAVSLLGANKSCNMVGGTVTFTVAVPRTIRPGYHLQILGTAAAGTGAGVWRMYVTYRPCLQSAVLE